MKIYWLGAFCKLFFYFLLMKVEGSTETLGLLETLYIALYNFNHGNVFYFLINIFAVRHFTVDDGIVVVN